MNKSVSISLAKFLDLYYNIPWSDAKYLKHKDLKHLIPDLEEVYCDDIYFYNLKLLTGEYIEITDSSKTTICYKNLFYYKHDEIGITGMQLNFESEEEFVNAPMYYRFTQYENVTENNYTIIDKTKDEIYDMSKWQLLNYRKRLKSNVKITLNNYRYLNLLIKNQLGKISKAEKEARRAYQKKKEREYYD